MASQSKQRAQFKHYRKRSAGFKKAVSTVTGGRTWAEMNDSEKMSTRDKLRAFTELRTAANALYTTRVRNEHLEKQGLLPPRAPVAPVSAPAPVVAAAEPTKEA
jgi:hypothetical protein